jgi:5,5'-dehydrodivanillate O-demethylase
MLTAEENELLTRVGPGTPAGEMLRRYWWPVGLSDEVKARGAPRRARLLGEDLVLFRDGQSQLGVLALHCSHRGTSLEYGRVEESGIRCPYHGWLYDRTGQCLDQPAEPEGSAPSAALRAGFKDRIRHPAYLAEELGGLVFAYLGPQPAPLLPRYDLLLREDGARLVWNGGTPGHFNWLQNVENAVDQAHLPFLHASVYPSMAMKRPSIDWERTWYGVKATTRIPGIPTEKVSIFIYPAHNRFTGARKERTPSQNMVFRVPVDDEWSNVYLVNFYPGMDPASLQSGDVDLRARDLPPGVYLRVDDGWWGVASRDQDQMAVETQGPIADRASEHLATSDRGVIMLRDMVKEAIEDVRQGRDPIGVIRDVEENEYISFDAQMEEIGVLV